MMKEAREGGEVREERWGHDGTERGMERSEAKDERRLIGRKQRDWREGMTERDKTKRN